MIVCRECGERQDDGTVFCGRCGAFLEWEGERIGPPQDESPQDESQPQQDSPQPVPVPAPVLPKRGEWIVESEPAATAAAAPAADPPTSPTPQAVPDVVPEPVPQQIPEPAPALVVARQPEQVVSRQPEEVRARPTTPAPRQVEQLPTGSLICGDCGTGNDPSRRFCLRCGASLATARIVERPPWWRRLLSRERTYAAGTRRRPRKRVRLLLPITLLVLLGLALVAVGPLRPTVVGAFRDVQNMLLPPQQVRPTEVVASSSSPEHGAALAVDGANNTYWAATPEEPVPWLQATLAAPTDLVVLGVTPGVSLQTPEFLAGPRPAALEVSVTTGTGTAVRRFDLADNPGFVEVPLEVADARVVQVSVLTNRGSTPTEATAITELELYARR